MVNIFLKYCIQKNIYQRIDFPSLAVGLPNQSSHTEPRQQAKAIY